MRDRLVELLDNATVEKAKCYPNGTPAIMYCEKAVSRQVVYQLADYLLANGVIVPRCKVGDDIYRIGGGECGKIYADWQVMYIQVYADEILYIDDSNNYFYETDIGKTVFLSLEEAEQALKGGAE